MRDGNKHNMCILECAEDEEGASLSFACQDPMNKEKCTHYREGVVCGGGDECWLKAAQSDIKSLARGFLRGRMGKDDL